MPEVVLVNWHTGERKTVNVKSLDELYTYAKENKLNLLIPQDFESTRIAYVDTGLFRQK